MKKRYILLSAALVLVASLGLTLFAMSEPLPEGEAGPAADALAHEIEAAIHKDAWERTGAVTWYFGGRNRHVWDRNRRYSQVTWGSGADEMKVQLSLDDQSKAVVTRGGQPVTGADRDKAVKDAYAKWINDSFWLNPLAKLFDPGTVRKVVPAEDGSKRLMLSYMSGGLTPGDSYLYTLGPDKLPTKWNMWVSIIPVGGVEASWGGWITLDTGAKASTRHEMLFRKMTLELTEVKGAATIEALAGSDLFAPLEAVIQGR